MPVVITGADTALGRAVVAGLHEALGGGHGALRATCSDRATAAQLLASGVPAAVSDLVDPVRLGAVLEGAHTVIHLHGSDDPSGTHPSWDYLLDAAEDTSVRRLVTVGRPGDAPPPVPQRPEGPAYDVVLVRFASGTPVAAVVAALLAADRRGVVAQTEVIDVPDQAGGDG